VWIEHTTVYNFGFQLWGNLGSSCPHIFLQQTYRWFQLFVELSNWLLYVWGGFSSQNYVAWYPHVRLFWKHHMKVSINVPPVIHGILLGFSMKTHQLWGSPASLVWSPEVRPRHQLHFDLAYASATGRQGAARWGLHNGASPVTMGWIIFKWLMFNDLEDPETPKVGNLQRCGHLRWLNLWRWYVRSVQICKNWATDINQRVMATWDRNEIRGNFGNSVEHLRFPVLE
jgi:hypothetical protein